MAKDEAEAVSIGHQVTFKGQRCVVTGRGRNRLGNPTFTLHFRGHDVTVSYAHLDQHQR